MAAALTVQFDNWLKETLIKLNTDDEIFSPYIKGILDTDETIEEKTEALQGIISEITDTNIEQLCKEILQKWNSDAIEDQKLKQSKDTVTSDSIDNKLAQLLEKQASCLPLAAHSKATSERVALKKAILAQYSQMSGDEADGDTDGVGGATGGQQMVKNTNASSVEEEVKQKREQSRQDHKIKKDKDKEEREKQKTKADERKEKEKKRTAKGERRR